MSIQVIDRLTKLLDILAHHGEPVSLKVLSAETGLHTSTAFRILNSALENGLVSRDGERYQLGPKLISLGRRAGGGNDLIELAQPILAELRDEVGESVNLTVREGDEVIYVGRELAKRIMRVEQVIGSRAPLHVTAVGKLMLGASGEQAIREYAYRNGLCRYTENTITDVNALVQQCMSDHRKGIALDNEEAEIGVGCIGVILRDTQGKTVAGISISAPLERRDERWGTLLVAARDKLAREMGC